MPRSLCSMGSFPEPYELLRYGIENKAESIKIIYEKTQGDAEITHLKFQEIYQIYSALDLDD